MKRTASPLVLWAALASLVAPSLAAEWGGDGCAEVESLRANVDAALQLAPIGDGRGSGAPGLSVAVQHDACGRFAYATGRRRIEGGKRNKLDTRHHVGSMTKPVTTALTLILAEEGVLGDQGIDSKVAPFFTKAERQALTKGIDPDGKLCPNGIQAVDRSTDEFVDVRAKCPKLKKITVRHLLNGNHGMWDFVNEVDRNRNGYNDIIDYVLGDLLEAMGVDRLPPAEATNGFEVLTTTGILKAKGARLGGRRPVDFERSFGNTGYQLLGLILERVSGESFDALVDKHIVEPLGLSPMLLATEVPKPLGNLASEYAITTGAADSGLDGVNEDLLGAYPLVDVNGHPAINVFDTGPLAFTNGGGGAGALSATPDSYVQFFHHLVTGGLLSGESQQLLEDGFLQIEGEGFEHGFALFRVQGPLGTLINKGGATAGSSCFAVHSVAGQSGNGATVVVCRNSADLFLPNPDTGVPNSTVEVEALALDLLQLARP